MSAPQVAVQPYDFRTGTELSREALQNLRNQCERLAATLTRIMHAYLDSTAEFTVTACEPLSFERYLNELPDNHVLGPVEFSARRPHLWWQMDPALAGAVLGRMLGGEPEALTRRVTPLEAAVLRRFFQEIMDVWSSSWRRMAAWSPIAAPVIAGGGQLQGLVHAGELVRVAMKVEVSGAQGGLDLLLPVSTAQRMVAEEPRSATEPSTVSLAEAGAAQSISIPLAVWVHRGRLPLSELLRLGVGDVIPLGKPLNDPLIVAVRGQPKFLAQAGVRGGRLAARILEPISPA